VAKIERKRRRIISEESKASHMLNRRDGAPGWIARNHLEV